jgi:DNA-binding IclR family transcriptional regulator
VESDFVVRNVLGIGNRLPLFAGGGGKALLAFQPAEVQDQVIAQHVRALTAFTPTTAPDVHRDLAAIRRDGYWIALEEFTEGADAVGAAVFDARGTATAGLGIAGPTRRMRDRLDSQEKRGELVQPVVDAAIAISRRLGYQGPYPPPVEADAHK